MKEVTIYIGATRKQFEKWLVDYTKRAAVDNSTYCREGDLAYYGKQAIWLEGQWVIPGAAMRDVKGQGLAYVDRMDFARLDLLEIGADRLQVRMKYLAERYTTPYMVEFMNAIGRAWPEVDSDLTQNLIETYKEVGIELKAGGSEGEAVMAKQQGRYRLTVDDITYRKEIVKKAEEIHRDTGKSWKLIARQLGIPERTLRDYRHNPLYQ